MNKPFDVPAGSWPLPLWVCRWIADEAKRRALGLEGVVSSELGWEIGEPDSVLEALPPGAEAWMAQQPGCAGPRTAIVFVANGAHRGGWVCGRPPGCPEPTGWRVLILEALVTLSRQLDLATPPPALEPMLTSAAL